MRKKLEEMDVVWKKSQDGREEEITVEELIALREVLKDKERQGTITGGEEEALRVLNEVEIESPKILSALNIVRCYA